MKCLGGSNSPSERERTKNSRRVSGGPSDGGSSAPSVERENGKIIHRSVREVLPRRARDKTEPGYTIGRRSFVPLRGRDPAV